LQINARDPYHGRFSRFRFSNEASPRHPAKADRAQDAFTISAGPVIVTEAFRLGDLDMLNEAMEDNCTSRIASR